MKIYKQAIIKVRQDRKNEAGNRKFKKSDLRKTYSVFYNYLENFSSNFGICLKAYYQEAKPWTKLKLNFILGRRLWLIIESSQTRDITQYPTIYEIEKLHKWLNLETNFHKYFISKTCLSYSMFPGQQIIPDIDFAKNEQDAIALKFSEFIYVIMTLYTLLHNLMFQSGYKLKCIQSIDTFLKDI